MSGRDIVAPSGKGTYFDNKTNGFTSKNVQDAIEEVKGLATPLRVPIPLIHNGTVSDNTFIGYSNLLSGDTTPIIVPIPGLFIEFTWSNSRMTADFALEFRIGSTTATPFYTYTQSNIANDAVMLPSPQSVGIGDKFYVKYLDQGTNVTDMAVILLFKA